VIARRRQPGSAACPFPSPGCAAPLRSPIDARNLSRRFGNFEAVRQPDAGDFATRDLRSGGQLRRARHHDQDALRSAGPSSRPARAGGSRSQAAGADLCGGSAYMSQKFTLYGRSLDRRRTWKFYAGVYGIPAPCANRASTGVMQLRPQGRSRCSPRRCPAVGSSGWPSVRHAARSGGALLG